MLTHSPSVPVFTVHLHNSLVLGLLYNASADVPGPSTRSGTGMLHERDANGQLVDADGNVVGRFADADDDLEMLQPAKKRLRLLTAGLSRKERARIRNIPKQLAHSRSLGLGGSLSLGWAGAGADMLEKKRKEEEKRRSAEEKQRVKEAYTEIGLPDWKAASLQDQSYITSMHDRLPACKSASDKLFRLRSAKQRADITRIHPPPLSF